MRASPPFSMDLARAILHSPELQRVFSCQSGPNCMLQGEGKGQARSNSPQDVVRELYAGVDLPKLVQRMLVVMHEVQ